MQSTHRQNPGSSKQPNSKSSQNIFYRIWNPIQDDYVKAKMFFRLSLTMGMVLSLILYMLGNIQTVAYILILFLFLLIVLRVTMAIRMQITTSSKIDSTSNKFFSKLPDEHRKKFFMSAFVYMPIGYFLGIIPILAFINYMSKSTGKTLSHKAMIFICLICLLCLLVCVYSIWNYYNTLCSDKKLLKE